MYSLFELPGRWIGRWGQTEWPPGIQDLGACDLHLWACARQEVSRSQPTALYEREP